jgi:hypothetical protein
MILFCAAYIISKRTHRKHVNFLTMDVYYCPERASTGPLASNGCPIVERLCHENMFTEPLPLPSNGFMRHNISSEGHKKVQGKSIIWIDHDKCAFGLRRTDSCWFSSICVTTNAQCYINLLRSDVHATSESEETAWKTVKEGNPTTWKPSSTYGKFD